MHSQEVHQCRVGLALLSNLFILCAVFCAVLVSLCANVTATTPTSCNALTLINSIDDAGACAGKVPDGTTCELPAAWCDDRLVLVTSLRCERGVWRWATSPTVSFCPFLASTCRWEENTLHCDRNSNTAASHRLVVRNLDPEVERVTITGYTILSLANQAFEGLTRLRHLNLSHNELRVYNRGVLLGLSVLEELDLSHNKLDSIDTYKLPPPRGRLAWVDLRGNNPALVTVPIDRYTFRPALDFCRQLHVDDAANIGESTERTLLMDAGGCFMRKSLNLHADQQVYCERVECTNDAPSPLLDCPGSSDGDYSGPRLCDGERDCPDGIDEMSFCDAKPIALPVPHSDNVGLCGFLNLEDNFGETIQSHNGLLIADTSNFRASYFESLPLILWSRVNLTHATLALPLLTGPFNFIESTIVPGSDTDDSFDIDFKLTNKNNTKVTCRYSTAVLSSSSGAPAGTTQAWTTGAPNSSTRAGGNKGLFAGLGAAVALVLLLTVALLLRQRQRTTTLRRHLEFAAPITPATLRAKVRGEF